MTTLGVVLSLALNVICSVGVILVNKRLVYIEANFNLSTALTIIHFFVTFLGCVAFGCLQCYKPKRLPLRGVLPVSIAFCGYVVFNNISLLKNSMTVYQIAKIVNTPCILMLEKYLYGKTQSRDVKLALIPVCIGAFMTVYGSAYLSWEGAISAVLAIVMNSLYTIWGKTKQEELMAQPMQLLLYQSIISTFFLLLVGPFLDGVSEWENCEITFTTVWAVLVSCVFAFGVNFSFFLSVGKTSPLTMNVLGYFKTALVFIAGYLFVPTAHVSPLTTVGTVVTLVGLAFYTAAQAKKNSQPQHPVKVMDTIDVVVRWDDPKVHDTQSSSDSRAVLQARARD